ncbi:RrF2 family transcriptional regulator [Olsenella uli]|uniref:RrF2 family transcriptional regulator n=1 Tax=Olsenella uli TaxID=133926 RepID=UPI0012AB5590|nr:Rrf2 family transcriptional regulator [Olsenella uli]
MDISRKTDYALRMLTDLVRTPSGVISVRSAADGNGVPYSFARSIQHDLSRAGIIESLRGSRGGMRLMVDPASVTLLQVVEAVQGPSSVSACATSGPDGGVCPRAASCCYNPIWAGAQELLGSYLSSVTLAQVVAGEARPVVEERFTRPGGSGCVSSVALRDARAQGAPLPTIDLETADVVRV